MPGRILMCHPGKATTGVEAVLPNPPGAQTGVTGQLATEVVGVGPIGQLAAGQK
jgi:hypothetical protein